MNNQELTQNESYQKLLAAVKSEILIGRKAVEHRLAHTYWSTGKLIANHILHHGSRAGYGEKVFLKLGIDLNMDPSTLSKTVKFYRQFPILDSSPKLTWTHYRSILSVGNKAKRKRILQKAKTKKLTVSELQKEMKQACSATIDVPNVSSKYSELKDKRKFRLRFKRGKLFTYKVLEVTRKSVVLECGFRVWRRVPILSRSLNVGDIVEVIKKGSSFKLKKINVTADLLFTYNAYLKRVVDGDTIRASVDCGFDTGVEIIFRLRGIDCPKIGTPEGDAAKKFVQSCMKPGQHLIIKTYKIDKYHRYVADIFFDQDSQALIQWDPKSESAFDSTYLNQLLLDEDHAVVWE